MIPTPIPLYLGLYYSTVCKVNNFVSNSVKKKVNVTELYLQLLPEHQVNNI